MPTERSIKEPRRSSEGVLHKRGETNYALAQRDYSKSCRLSSSEIIVFDGYHIWWCHSHYQPEPWCEKEMAELKAKRINDAINILIESIKK